MSAMTTGYCYDPMGFDLPSGYDLQCPTTAMTTGDDRLLADLLALTLWRLADNDRLAMIDYWLAGTDRLAMMGSRLAMTTGYLWATGYRQ